MKNWSRQILDVYWDIRPCAETQNLYKSKKLDTHDYWFYELKFLTCSVWNRDDALPEYILKKYKNEKIQLDTDDKTILIHEFITDLGMNPTIFPSVIVEEILRGC